MPRFLCATLIALAALTAGCDSGQPASPGAQVVVAGFLEAGAPLPAVRVTRSIPIDGFYDPATASVTDAAVQVQLLAPDGSVEATVPYGPFRLDVLGFVPTVRPNVLPGRTYRLTATGLGTTVTAETTVPAALALVEAPPDEVVYQYNATGPPLRITTSSTAGRQSVYVASVTSLEADGFDEVMVGSDTRFRSQNAPGRFRPVPIALLFAGCDAEGSGLLCDREPSTSGSSGIINEASFTRLPDGTARVDVPWLAFGFYGLSDVSLVSLDAAFQDFVEGQTVQGGGSTLSPGEIPNITTNVRGGLGVFGSYARVSARTTVRER